MNDEKMGQNIDFTMKKDNLYREEIITDMNIGSIRKLVPIKIDGSQDTGRTVLFFGHTQLVSPQGPVPLQAPLAANNFQEALDVFPQTLRKSFNDMIANIQKMQKEEEEKKKGVQAQ